MLFSSWFLIKFPNVIVRLEGSFYPWVLIIECIFFYADGPIARGDSKISYSAMINWMQPLRASQKKNINIEIIRIAFTANRKREIWVKKFLNMRNEQTKTIVVDRVGVNLPTLHRFSCSYWMNSNLNEKWMENLVTWYNLRLSCFLFWQRLVVYCSL